MNNEDEVCNKDGVDDDNSYHISSNCSAMHFSLPNTGALDKPCNKGMQFGSIWVSSKMVVPRNHATNYGFPALPLRLRGFPLTHPSVCHAHRPHRAARQRTQESEGKERRDKLIGPMENIVYNSCDQIRQMNGQTMKFDLPKAFGHVLGTSGTCVIKNTHVVCNKFTEVHIEINLPNS